MDEPIEVRVPYKPGRKLGEAYNEAMDSSRAEWVLLLDWDLFNCNPHWYDLCVDAIRQYGHEAGWITCVTNSIGGQSQKAKNYGAEPPAGHDLVDHMRYGKMLHRKYNTMDPCTGHVVKTDVRRFKGALSGFFILTSKSAWRDAGGFDESTGRLLGIDNRYSRAVCQAGYRLMGMPGLYFYHVYRHKGHLWRTGPR